MRRTFTTALVAVAACLSADIASAQGRDQEKADFELVQGIGSRKAFEIFLNTYPDGRFADLVRQRLREMGAENRKMDPERRTRPNWGDDIFIPRLIDRQRHGR